MFQWSKKVVKSVTFNPEVGDESLLAVVDNYLEQLPDKTFSDICKEALWQALCVPETVKPSPKIVATDAVETKIDELQRQLADLEERFFCSRISSFGVDRRPYFATYATNSAFGSYGN